MAIGSQADDRCGVAPIGAAKHPVPRSPDPHGQTSASPRPSLRRRLATVLVGLALLIAIVQAGFVWLVGYRAEEQMIDRILAEQLGRSIAIYREQPALAAPNTPDMTLHVLRDGDPNGEAGLPVWLRSLPRERGSYEVYPQDGLEYHVAIERDGNAWFFLAYDVAEHEVRQHNEVATLALSVLAIGGLALLLSGRMAAGLTRDLQRLAVAVSGPDGARLDGPPLDALAAHAETAELAGALDAYRARLREAFERERAFSAAASHELRTPLMRAGSSLDLLRTGELDARQSRLIGNVQASLDEMTMLTAALLRVARGQSAEAAAEIALEPLVGEALERLRAEAQARGMSLANRIPPELRLRLDRSALSIVLGNLLRNAIRHSGGREVLVEWEHGTLLIEDDGIGPAAQAESGAGELATGAPVAAPSAGASGLSAESGEAGLGLGLTIVQKICEAAGWDFSIGARPGGGTRAKIGIGPS